MENTTSDTDNSTEKEELDFSEFQINTSNAYYLVRELQDDSDIPHKNLVEFRERLEEVLPLNAQPNLKFHPLSWEYHRDKYKIWERDKGSWRQEGSNIFHPYFFMSNASISGEITYYSLSEEDKKTVDESVRRTGDTSWRRWGYDAYTLSDDCPLSYEKHGEDFEFFFAWQLLLTDLLRVKLFLRWHLKKSFQNNLEEFKDFIEILYMKYEKILFRENNHKVVFKYLDKMEVEPISVQSITDEIEETTPKKSGRKPKEKIEIPIPPIRDKQKWTILSKDDTIKLFDYLIQLECLINDTDKVSKSSLAKAIYAMTGYSYNDTAEMFIFEDKKPKTKKEKESIALDIKALIINNLK